MASNIFEFNTPEDLKTWGKSFSKGLRVGDVVALVGELGAGKTTLVQSIAKAWGAAQPASSPTFALANEYKTRRGMIYHMDMYRLTAKELMTFPLDDYWDTGLCLIEWADRIKSRLPRSTVEIHLNITGPTTRTLQLKKKPLAR